MLRFGFVATMVPGCAVSIVVAVCMRRARSDETRVPDWIQRGRRRRSPRPPSRPPPHHHLGLLHVKEEVGIDTHAAVKEEIGIDTHAAVKEEIGIDTQPQRPAPTSSSTTEFSSMTIRGSAAEAIIRGLRNPSVGPSGIIKDEYTSDDSYDEEGWTSDSRAASSSASFDANLAQDEGGWIACSDIGEAPVTVESDRCNLQLVPPKPRPAPPPPKLPAAAVKSPPATRSVAPVAKIIPKAKRIPRTPPKAKIILPKAGAAAPRGPDSDSDDWGPEWPGNAA